jgi:hypothetical protein
MRGNTVACACGLAALLNGVAALPSLAQQPLTLDNVSGAWSIVSFRLVHADGSKSDVFGEHPQGTLTLDRSGTYSMVLVDPRRPKWRSDRTKNDDTDIVVAAKGHCRPIWDLDPRCCWRRFRSPHRRRAQSRSHGCRATTPDGPFRGRTHDHSGQFWRDRRRHDDPGFPKAKLKSIEPALKMLPICSHCANPLGMTTNRAHFLERAREAFALGMRWRACILEA